MAENRRRQKVLVIPDGSGWAVKLQWNWIPVSAHPHHIDALRVGREIAARQGAELVVHDDDCNVVHPSQDARQNSERRT